MKHFTRILSGIVIILATLLFSSCVKEGPMGPQGPPGVDGNTILGGTGIPSATTGKAGDFYIDLATTSLYGPKTNKGWGTPISLKGNPGPAGADGSRILSGAGEPAFSIGKTGDYYIDFITGSLYGPKDGNGWGTPINLKGPQGEPGVPGPAGSTILSGSGIPSAGIGKNGDFYLDLVEYKLYGPKANNAWGSFISLKGSAGEQGPQGPGGTSGKTILSGTTAPAPGIGTIGDFYLNTLTLEFYGPKTATGWGNPINMPDGNIQEPMIFIGGYVNVSESSQVPKYWKNSQGIPLTANVRGRVSCVFAAGNDVYFGGYQFRDEMDLAMYWKNGVPVTLAVRGTIGSLFMSGTDLYATGSGTDGSLSGTMYWKNGIATLLSDREGGAHSIYVAGSTVYVAGYEVISGDAYARYWKNGIMVSLNDNYSTAHSVKVTGNDVFIAGSAVKDRSQKATCWKNGTPIYLENTGSSVATSLFIADGFVHIVGFESSIRSMARYWKLDVATGKLVEASYLTDGTQIAQAGGVHVYNKDVYIAGYEYNADGKAVAKYWKNGVAVNLSNGAYSEFATSIFVK